MERPTPYEPCSLARKARAEHDDALARELTLTAAKTLALDMVKDAMDQCPREILEFADRHSHGCDGERARIVAGWACLEADHNIKKAGHAAWLKREKGKCSRPR